MISLGVCLDDFQVRTALQVLDEIASAEIVRLAGEAKFDSPLLAAARMLIQSLKGAFPDVYASVFEL